MFYLILAYQGKIYLHIELDLYLEIYWDPQPRASTFYWHFCLTAQKELLQWRWILLVLIFPYRLKGFCTAATVLVAWIKCTKNLSSGRQVFATKLMWAYTKSLLQTYIYISFLDVGYNSSPICNSATAVTVVMQ